MELLKALLSGRLLSIAGVARLVGAVLISLPLTSMLGMIWFYRDTRTFWLWLVAIYLFILLVLTWFTGVAPPPGFAGTH